MVMSSHQQQHTNGYFLEKKRSLQKSPREPIPPPIGRENLRNLESPVLLDNGGDINDQPSSSVKIVRSLRRTDSQVTSERKPFSNFKKGIHPRNVSTSSVSGIANPFDVTRPRLRKAKNSLAATTRAETAAAASTQEKNSSLTTTSASLEEQPGGDVKEVQQVPSGTESPKPVQPNVVVSGTVITTGLKDDQSLLSQNMPPEQRGPGSQEQTSEASRDLKKSKEEKENPNNKENEDEVPLPIQRARSSPSLRKGLVDQVPMPVQRARSPASLRKGLVLQPCEGDGQNDDVRKNVIFQEATVHLQINSAANDTNTVMSSHQQQHTNEYLKRSLQKSPREPIPPPIGPENLRNLESPVLLDNGGDVNDQPSSSLKIVRSLRRTDSQVTSERKPFSNFKQGIHPRNVSTSSVSGLANPFDVTRPRPRKTKNSLAATTRAAAASIQEKNSSLTTTSASLEEQPGGDVKEVQQVPSGTESPKPVQQNEVVSENRNHDWTQR